MSRRYWLLYPAWIAVCAVLFLALRGADDPSRPRGRVLSNDAAAIAVRALPRQYRGYKAVHVALSDERSHRQVQCQRVEGGDQVAGRMDEDVKRNGQHQQGIEQEQFACVPRQKHQQAERHLGQAHEWQERARSIRRQPGIEQQRQFFGADEEQLGHTPAIQGSGLHTSQASRDRNSYDVANYLRWLV